MKPPDDCLFEAERTNTYSATVIGVGSLSFEETIIWRLLVQTWQQAGNNTGILNTCYNC